MNDTDPITRLNAALCPNRRTRGPLLGFAFLSLAATPLIAQEPPLRAVTALLAEAQNDSVATRRSVARRCSGLFSLVADRYERRRDLGTAEMYTTWSIGFEVAAVGADLDLGSTPEEALRNNEVEIAQIKDRLRDRMNRTRWLGDDPLLSSDVRTCRDLVDDLGLEGVHLAPLAAIQGNRPQPTGVGFRFVSSVRAGAAVGGAVARRFSPKR